MALCFSVVVPTRNRAAQLGELLAALAAQELPAAEWEVVIVDDAGNQPLEPVVAPFRAQLQITLLTIAHAGCAGARQAGVAVARGEHLAFTDDDCRPAPGWLRELQRALRAQPRAAVGGLVRNALPGNLFSTASHTLCRYLTARAGEGEMAAPFFTTNNVGFSARLFAEAGGMDARWEISGGEDRDLCDRWQRVGLALVYDPAVVIDHAHPLAWRSFWRQHFQYGRGAFRFHRVRAAREKRSLKLEAAGFYLRLPLFAFRACPAAQALPVAGLLVLSQVATAAGFFSEKRAAAGK